ncbi:MAG: cupredoxin domain-containing protein [Rickettsiales bacterium]|nr:cupredoxin domain-containing protein [Rickettsiales bacterium]
MKLALSFVAATLLSTTAWAETPSFELTLKDHQFEPATLEVPANQKVKLVVKNADSTPAEFESHSLGREKVIQGNSSATVLVGPLKPGEYKFEDEFNAKTAQGKLIAK